MNAPLLSYYLLSNSIQEEQRAGRQSLRLRDREAALLRRQLMQEVILIFFIFW